jgi:hypothetical protein
MGDARLLQLREWAFGGELAILTECPSCGQTLEMTMPTSAIRVSMGATDSTDNSLVLGDYDVKFHSPNSADIAACAGLELSQSRLTLLARCVTEARCQGNAVSTRALPGDVAREIEEQIAAIEPQADLRLDFICAECNRGWKQVFDIVSFFWMEIDAWARRILLDVSVLARAYGWRECDILALSPARRQIYLAMAQA